jgi:hypothetical protein
MGPFIELKRKGMTSSTEGITKKSSTTIRRNQNPKRHGNISGEIPKYL